MTFAINQWTLNLISGNPHWQWSSRWLNTTCVASWLTFNVQLMISMVFTPFFYQSMVLLVWGWLKGGTLGHCVKLKSWRFFFFLTHWEETFLAGSKAPDTLCSSPTLTPKKVILHNVMCEDFFLEEVTEARCPKIPYSNTGAKSTSPHLQRCREPGDELQQCLPSRVEIGNQCPKLFF